MNLKLNPATLYQLHHEENNRLTWHADNLRQSSQSQRQSMSHSSNLNYSPTTSMDKRSNSQSTHTSHNNQGAANLKASAAAAGESPGKSRGRLSHSRGSRPRSKPKSNSSSRASKSAGRHHQHHYHPHHHHQHRQQHQMEVIKSRKSMIKKHRQNEKVRDLRRKKQPVIHHMKSISGEDMDKEDLVIYIILTQAARMIQRAFRGFIANKKYLIEKDQFRSELEAELEEARSCRAQLRSIENPTGMTSSLANSILSPIADSKTNNVAAIDAAVVANARISHRKHTFSFGVREDEGGQSHQHHLLNVVTRNDASAQDTVAMANAA